MKMSENAEQKAFNDLLEQYYSAWFHYHPQKAVHIGVSGYEGKLLPSGDEQIGALISLNQKLIFALDELNLSVLTALQQLSYRVVFNAASIELHELMERDWRYTMPQKFLPMDSIYQLIQRPVDGRHQAFKHQLQAVAESLRSAKNFLLQQPQRIPAQWASLAIQEARNGSHYMRGLVHEPELTSQFENPTRLQPLCDEVAHELETFEKFLKEDIQPRAEGSFACGERYFNMLLNDGHHLSIDAAQLHQFAERLFKQTQQQLEALCKKLPGSDDIDEQLAIIYQQYPVKTSSAKTDPVGTLNENAYEQLMDAYRGRIHAACHFVAEQKLLTMPRPQSLKVQKPPGFLQHRIPFVAYDGPSHGDPEQRGYYYVTMVDAEHLLCEHNGPAIDVRCVHDIYPGHHLQSVIANQKSENALPSLLNASSLREGWALYCEDLMQAQGFLDSPAHQIIILCKRLRLASDVMLDVELHTRNLDVDEAFERMSDVAGFEFERAAADPGRYSESPTASVGSVVGRALIMALREQLSKNENAEGDGFNLQHFHDRLLSVGSFALPLVIKHAFGDEVWERVQSQVFQV